jgi:hypothetical protein
MIEAHVILVTVAQRYRLYLGTNVQVEPAGAADYPAPTRRVVNDACPKAFRARGTRRR